MSAPTPDQISAAIDLLRRADPAAIHAHGVHFGPLDFYSPVNDTAFLAANRDLWSRHEPTAIDLDPDRQLAVAREAAAYAEELRDIPADAPPGTDPARPPFHWNNRFWNAADALVQYGLVRSRRPRRYIEIGCGWSSLLLARALERNAADASAPPCEVTLIEPYPREHLLAQLPARWRRLPQILQRIPPETFDALGPGDILFYDGSHVVKTASDVVWFFFRVLPRLRPGVLIHLHDVFFPFDYPRDWLLTDGRTWNEQYLLQAFLMHNTAYRVLIANSHLHADRPAELAALYRGVQPPHGCSIWLEKLAV